MNVWPMCTSKPPVSWTTDQFRVSDAVDVPAQYTRCNATVDGFRCRTVFSYAHRKGKAKNPTRCRRHQRDANAPLWMPSLGYSAEFKEDCVRLAKEHGSIEAARIMEVPKQTIREWVKNAELQALSSLTA